MINIVIDTNVIVSAALSPNGNPAKVIALISCMEELQVFYSSAILSEYKRVLAYKRLNINTELQDIIINTLQKFGILIEPPISTMPMADETDRMFYDTARASSSILITGNLKHYPVEPFIMTAAEFIEKVTTT